MDRRGESEQKDISFSAVAKENTVSSETRVIRWHLVLAGWRRYTSNRRKEILERFIMSRMARVVRFLPSCLPLPTLSCASKGLRIGRSRAEKIPPRISLRHAGNYNKTNRAARVEATMKIPLQNYCEPWKIKKWLCN